MGTCKAWQSPLQDDDLSPPPNGLEAATGQAIAAYGGNARDYERALDVIEAGCKSLLALLTPKAKAQIA